MNEAHAVVLFHFFFIKCQDDIIQRGAVRSSFCWCEGHPVVLQIVFNYGQAHGHGGVLECARNNPVYARGNGCHQQFSRCAHGLQCMRGIFIANHYGFRTNVCVCVRQFVRHYSINCNSWLFLCVFHKYTKYL